MINCSRCPMLERSNSVFVLADSAHQALLGRQWNDVVLADAQVVGGVASNPLNGVLGVFFTLQVVPQYIDLIQHGKAAGPVIGVFGVYMVLPDGQVAGGHAGVGTQHEDHRVGAGQHADSQLRFGAQGVQSWRIENAQATLEQRMSDTDLGIPPGRYQYLTGVVAVVLQHVFVKAQLAGFLWQHALYPRHFRQHLPHDLRIALVQLVFNPALRLLAQLLQGQLPGAGFDGQ